MDRRTGDADSIYTVGPNDHIPQCLLFSPNLECPDKTTTQNVLQRNASGHCAKEPLSQNYRVQKHQFKTSLLYCFIE